MSIRSNGTGHEELISLEGVTKRWGETIVLDEVDVVISAGEVVSIAGGNGAGKTTMLRVATGMIVPDAGTARFRGEDIEDDLAAYQQELGFLSAGDRGLYARLTVRQNLDFWGGLAGLPRRRRRKAIEAVIAEFEIGELADRRVDRLSMGQRQRVRLAMTFLHEPTIVFLDEPRTSLDEAGFALLDAAISRLVDRGGAAVVASPEPTPLARRAWILQGGKIQPFEAGPTGPATSGGSEQELTTSGAVRR